MEQIPEIYYWFFMACVFGYACFITGWLIAKIDSLAKRRR